MSTNKQANVVGILVILGHFISVISVVVLFFRGGYLFEEMTTTLALVLPLFSIYTVAIFKYIIKNKGNFQKGDSVTKTYKFVLFFITIVFIMSLNLIIYLKAYNIGFQNFEQFKIALALIEIVFGGYMGMIMNSLYDSE